MFNIRIIAGRNIQNKCLPVYWSRKFYEKKIKQPKKDMICTTLQKMGSDTVSDFFPDSILQRLHHNEAKAYI